MTLQNLDAPILYLFLVMGLVFALFGLYLILKRKTDENAARIELFGLKFQSSSAGTLVFLVGAVFLLIPLFAPKPPNNAANAEDQTAVETVRNTKGGEEPNEKLLAQRAVLLPASANASEEEPNDNLTQSNQFALGFGVKGALNKKQDDYYDWYVVDISESENTEFTVQIRSPHGGCRVIAYDQNEEEIGGVYCNQSGGSRHFDFYSKSNDMIFIRVFFNGGSAASYAAYELFVSQK